MHFSSPAEIFGVDGIIILIVVVLVLFGSTQIPKLARSLGSAQKEFKKGVDQGASEVGAGTHVAGTSVSPSTATPPERTMVTTESSDPASAHLAS
ncbi:MAG TPA: twin-arginine translocase TatA/TatE family subunit [Acidimicrobiales bacterium]